MTDKVSHADVDNQRQLVRSLRFAVYNQIDPASDAELLKKLADAEEKLCRLEAHFVPPEQDDDQPAPSKHGKTPSGDGAGRFLGAKTTELTVDVQLKMNPLPTGAYHLMDPETDPLVCVEIENHSRDIRRVRIESFIEGLSARAVRTVEIEPRQHETLTLQPTLLPDRVQYLTEVQRATLHVVVDDLDGKQESHNTYLLTCLSRNASFNSVRRPESGELVDLSHYYGAWVTPHIGAVQEQIRSAISFMPDKQMLGYQGDPDVVQQQVEALYQALQGASIVYVNSVIDYGAGEELTTQRTRLPRESLAARSANCIDGTVLMASLIEGVSLNPAILLVPGHALVGWETWSGSNEWQFLETTLIGTEEFSKACESGNRQHQQYAEFNPDRIKLHSLSQLRRQGIWPME